MSDEIYINTGTSFQQQYTARQPAIGTAPVTAQYDAQGNANQQQPYTYQDRAPYTFQATGRTPYIANAQSPYPYIANNQTPYIANKQNPYPYPASAQNPYPYIANAQQPYPYIASSQTPYPASAQQPYPYPASAQQPYPYQANAQQPYPYIADSQTPFTYQARSPSTTPISVAQAQNPYIANRQTPYPAIGTTQARTPVNVQTPLGSGIQHTKQDNTTSGNLTVQFEGYESANEYIVSRSIQLRFRIHWWRHSNGYGYAYWYVRRGAGYFNFTPQQANVYLSTGTVSYSTTAWRLVEQWSFWNSIFPDNLQMGTAGVTAEVGSGSNPVVCTTGSDTTASCQYQKSFYWDCEEGQSIPSSGNRNGTITMVPTATKSGYNNLTGGSHGCYYNFTLSCDWSPGGCFIAGTKVLLEDNTTKNIEDMQVGDTVIGKDGVVNTVKELRTHDFENYAIYTINGSIEVSGNHPMLTTDGWKSCDSEAGKNSHPILNPSELVIGDKLLKDAGNANGDTVEEEITTLTVETHSTIRVYNLDVTDTPNGNDTFVVNNYIVHDPTPQQVSS